MGAARVAHARKQRVQLVGFRGGALGLDHLVADQVLVGADQADLVARVLQYVLDQVGGRGLAVGARHAKHHHAVRRVTEAVGRDLGERTARIFHHDSRDACGRLLAHDGRRALRERFVDILMSVGRVAADGDKQVARLHGARIISHFMDFKVLRRRAAQHSDIFQQFL